MHKLAKKSKPIGWTKTNDALRNASENEAAQLLEAEKAGAARIDFCYEFMLASTKCVGVGS